MIRLYSTVECSPHYRWLHQLQDVMLHPATTLRHVASIASRFRIPGTLSLVHASSLLRLTQRGTASYHHDEKTLYLLSRYLTHIASISFSFGINCVIEKSQANFLSSFLQSLAPHAGTTASHEKLFGGSRPYIIIYGSARLSKFARELGATMMFRTSCKGDPDSFSRPSTWSRTQLREHSPHGELHRTSCPPTGPKKGPEWEYDRVFTPKDAVDIFAVRFYNRI